MNRRHFVLHLVLAIVSGALYALAFPDYSIAPLAFVCLAPLLIALQQTTSSWRAFLLGWVSQVVAWLMMVPWVVRVMSHYGGLPLPVGIAIFIAMALYLGIFGGLFGWIVYRLRLDHRMTKWLLVPLAWAAVEYARTYLFTGFPWNLLASAIVDLSSFVQMDRFAGPYLLGALLVSTSSLIAWLVTQKTLPIQKVLVLGAFGIFILVWWGTGLVAAKLFSRPTGTTPATAALLQPNIEQQMRWDPANTVRIYDQMIAMTREAADRGAHVVIWPESTVPLAYGTASNTFFQEGVEAIARERNLDIILGAVAEDEKDPTKLWNSAFLVTNGKTVGHYDKIRLVPFGEYVPLRKMLFFAEKLVRDVGEFQFGTNDNPLVGRFRYGPAICYEVVYPQIARTQVLHGANVLVTITNDAWYDGTSAPRQHLNQARLRAIEMNRYLLRAGTTGISAVVDPSGHLLKQLPMGQQGTIMAEFQPRKDVTPYARFGDWFSWVALVGTLAAIATGKRQKEKGKSEPA